MNLPISWEDQVSWQTGLTCARSGSFCYPQEHSAYALQQSSTPAWYVSGCSQLSLTVVELCQRPDPAGPHDGAIDRAQPENAAGGAATHSEWRHSVADVGSTPSPELPERRDAPRALPALRRVVTPLLPARGGGLLAKGFSSRHRAAGGGGQGVLFRHRHEGLSAEHRGRGLGLPRHPLPAAAIPPDRKDAGPPPAPGGRRGRYRRGGRPRAGPRLRPARGHERQLLLRSLCPAGPHRQRHGHQLLRAAGCGPRRRRRAAADRAGAGRRARFSAGHAQRPGGGARRAACRGGGAGQGHAPLLLQGPAADQGAAECRLGWHESPGHGDRRKQPPDPAGERSGGEQDRERLAEQDCQQIGQAAAQAVSSMW
uniref:Uncharacterized protein n=1 Tax=Auxenochlorella protothecoides TaxID=3075 RepID=A0A1D2A1Z4_AUXPR